jgi:hypothetical protein
VRLKMAAFILPKGTICPVTNIDLALNKRRACDNPG